MKSYDWKHVLSAKRPVKQTCVFIALSLLAVVPTDAQRSITGIVDLELYPAKIAEMAQPYRLITPADKQKDADALPLYEQAIQLMPKDVDKKLISDWMDMPLEQFPQERAEAMIQKHTESLRLVARASRCKNCNWPEGGIETPNMSGYRDFAFVIGLWTRLEISRGQYDSALPAMQTALGMARHLGQAPKIVQPMAAVAIGAIMCEEIEQFVQGEDSPNLYTALAELPEPFVDMEKAIKNEEEMKLKTFKGSAREELESALDRVRSMARRLDNHFNALQVVEAIRNYVAVHDGQLPPTLSDIKDIKIPNDLISGKAFEYHHTATGATLKSAIPEGGRERDAVHYEIVIRK